MLKNTPRIKLARVVCYRSENSGVIMQMMQQAVDELNGQAKNGTKRGAEAVGRVACRSAFRLARYTDLLYRNLQAQKLTPEWATAQLVVKHKKRQVRA